jgi:hypothetical protein
MKIQFTLYLMLLVGLATAQDNDTAVLRKNKVVEVQKFQFVHAFIENKDTCLHDVKRYNSDFLLTYHKINMACMGWQNTEENAYTYRDKNLVLVQQHRDGELSSSTQLIYAKKEEKPAVTSTYFHQTFDSSVIKNVYFRDKKGRLDSTYSTIKNPDGTLLISNTIARYNDANQIVQLYIIDGKRKPQQMMSYDFDKGKKMKSAAVTTYGEKPTFTQTYFEYNQFGQIASTINTVNQKQEYFYYPNGLLQNILSYNPKGALELEYIFKYKE